MFLQIITKRLQFPYLGDMYSFITKRLQFPYLGDMYSFHRVKQVLGKYRHRMKLNHDSSRWLHATFVNGKQSTWDCKICGTVFQSYLPLKLHLVSHNTSAEHHYHTLDDGFTDREQLKASEDTHSETRSENSDTCELDTKDNQSNHTAMDALWQNSRPQLRVVLITKKSTDMTQRIQKANTINALHVYKSSSRRNHSTYIVDHILTYRHTVYINVDIAVLL